MRSRVHRSHLLRYAAWCALPTFVAMSSVASAAAPPPAAPGAGAGAGRPNAMHRAGPLAAVSSPHAPGLTPSSNVPGLRAADQSFGFLRDARMSPAMLRLKRGATASAPLAAPAVS